MATGGMTAAVDTSTPTQAIEIPEPAGSGVITPAPQPFETVEIMRELQKHGCMIGEFKRTNSIHWQQLHLTCTAPLPLPGD